MIVLHLLYFRLCIARSKVDFYGISVLFFCCQLGIKKINNHETRRIPEHRKVDKMLIEEQTSKYIMQNGQFNRIYILDFEETYINNGCAVHVIELIIFEIKFIICTHGSHKV